MKYALLSNGRRIVYHTGGRSKNAVPLVLLHGFCEDSSVWKQALPLLRSGRFVRVDLPGFGGSDTPLTPGMDQYADAVCCVLNELGINRCVLAGHSMGGYTALAFARQYPERLAGLGLVHSHPYADEPERRENRRRGIQLLEAGKKDQYVAQLFPGLFAPDFAARHPEIVQMLVRAGRRQSTAGIIAALQGMIERPDCQVTLRGLSCPVLLLAGEQDSIISPDAIRRAALLPNVTDLHILTGVGHMGMFEATAATADILLRFWRLCLV